MIVHSIKVHRTNSSCRDTLARKLGIFLLFRNRRGQQCIYQVGSRPVKDPVRHRVFRSPIILSQRQWKIHINRNKFPAHSSSGSSCTISGVPGWMQPEAGSVYTAGTEVPFCRRYVVRCTVKPVNPRSGSVRAGVNEINFQPSKNLFCHTGHHLRIY